MEHEHLTFRVAYVSWPLWLLYGFYTAFGLFALWDCFGSLVFASSWLFYF